MSSTVHNTAIDTTIQSSENNTNNTIIVNNVNNKEIKKEFVKPNILDKLRNFQDKNDWRNWTLEEQKEMLEIYYLICEKESYLFRLICNNNADSSWDDILLDYDSKYLDDKTTAVRDALDMINKRIKISKL